MAKTSKSDSEINKFELMAEDWWNPTGKFKPLHDLTPVRLKYIVNLAKKHFAIDSLKNITALDVGCGGGLITEALARLELNIMGIDASEVNINIAKAHAKKMDLDIDYQQMLAEDITKKRYELILALEIVEHVEDLEFFIKTCCKLLAPGGLIIFSTLNKTIKSYLQAIIAAEYILKWVPKGTHDWKKFVKPSEINKYASHEGLELADLQGLSYSILSNTWSLSSDIGNNYFIAFSKIKNP
jgi:2-polyprenyl-6-hydroxyphenyl methylase/3-demethylubiquinone-9 3-methyltransferase